MIIERIVIDNYKLIKHADFLVNPDMNIFVGDNDSGKSTLLEAIAILTSGKLNGFAFERQLKANLFNDEERQSYIDSLQDLATVQPPTKMFFEAYCIDAEEYAEYKGRNNSRTENCPGIRIDVEMKPPRRKQRGINPINPIRSALHKSFHTHRGCLGSEYTS